LSPPPDRAGLIDWACNAALDRLGFATTGEIAAFWALVSPNEAKAWAAARNDLVDVEIEAAKGEKPRRRVARIGALEGDPPAPPDRVRVLSPFDPLLRNRKRARELFGFDYTIEVFVPAAKRKYGYYVFPLMEGDAMIGRIDMKADRKADELVVKGLWLEPKVKLAKGRMARLEAELERQRRFAGLAKTRFLDGWVRT
ncbi:MAG: crosslink repair DNA glycosylase YcaQ family protein, partial [Pseudomonadota bacterium]